MKFWFWLFITLCVVAFSCYKIKQYATNNAPSKEQVQQIYKEYSMQDITRIHDDEKGVTCYVLRGGYMGSKAGLSCIPDNQLINGKKL